MPAPVHTDAAAPASAALDGWIKNKDALSTALVADALDGLGLRGQSPRIALPARTGVSKIVGRCRTTLWMDFAHPDPGTYDLELAAIDDLNQDDVVIAATGGSQRSGIWGELLSTASRSHGAAGVVTDGAVRDLRKTAEMRFAVFAQHLSVYDSYNRQKVVARDVPVEIGGVAVAPGDIVMADEDGVVFVPAGVADAALEAALAKLTAENAFRDAVRSGMPALEAYRKFNVL